MKHLLYSLICLALLPSVSRASDECYDFDVRSFSKGLEKIELSVSPLKASPKRFVTTIIARKAKGRFTSTAFGCTRVVGKLNCVSADGAGDFQLFDSKDIPVLKLSYVNLIIGSTGSVALKGNAEITEEFALYDVKNGDETESEEESGELGSVSLTGQRIACSSKI